ncbi:MAG: EscU/YscU/HrcU family type III secretion system export apparatus switch protein, partial [Acidithiobacillus sp.]
MAEETAQERTEAASPKRRQDARKKGQIARSRELSTSTVLLVSAAAFSLGAKGIYDHAVALLHAGLQLSGPVFYSRQDLLHHFAALLDQMVQTVLPFFLLLFVAALLAGVAIGGWAFSLEALAPDWTRIDPISGVQRIISKHGLLELVKAVLKTLVVGGIGVSLLWSQRGALLGLIMEAPDRSMIHLM